MTKSRRPVADDIDLATLGSALWRAKGWIFGLAIGLGVVTFVGLSMVRPLYTSEARILIQNDESVFLRPTDQRIEPRAALDEQTVQSQVQVLTSRDLILKVVKDLDLTSNAAFARDAGQTMLRRLLNRFGLGLGSPESQEGRAANALAEHLDVFQLSRSSVIAVEYTSGDPKLAAQIANKLADVYIGWQRTAKIEQTKDATAWLSAQIDVLRQQVAASEEEAEKFRASKGLFAGSNNITLNAQQLSELNSQLILADAQKSEAEARARLIKKMLADNGDIDATPEVLKSQLIINLIEQRVEVQRSLAELSATLLPSHPRIQQLRSELADVRSQILSEARKVIKSLENGAQVAAAREASLRASLDAAKTKSAGLGDAEIKLRALQREAKANRDLLESYLARYRDASARHDMGAVPAQAAIVSRAHASVLPSFPKRGPLTLLVMVATALLALAYVLARELIAGAGANVPQREQKHRPKQRRRTEREQPEPAEPAPVRMAPQMRPVGSRASALRKRAATKTVPPERKLPVVIPVTASPSDPVKMPRQVEPNADTELAAHAENQTPSAPPPWRAKPAKKPSWLRVNETRGPRATLDRPAPASTRKSETPPASEMPSTDSPPAPETTVKPAATGLLDRLRQEYADSAGDASPSPQKSKPRLSGFLDRFRRTGAEDPGAEDSSAVAKIKPTSKGIEMSSLSPNDLRHYLTQRIASSDGDETIGALPATKAGGSHVGPVLKSLDAVLDRVLASATGGFPRALLVASVSPKADATQAAIGLARALVDRDEQVVLLDLAKGASAVSGPLGMPRVPGFTDLAAGQASFADVIRVDEDTPLQVITAGNPAATCAEPEPDRFMRVFEALTQAYDCVVLHADLGSVQTLMPALKFELPMTIAVLPEGASIDSEEGGLSTFQALGCPVIVYEGGRKPRRMGLFNRTAAV